MHISDDLCAFLGKPVGTHMSRSDVTKGIVGYTKIHQLMDKQRIKADATLGKLLDVTDTDDVNPLNLMAHLLPHFLEPRPVSDAFCTFSEKPIGTTMRFKDMIDVVRQYAEARQLIGSEQNITPDTALCQLLALSEADTLTPFLLRMKLMDHLGRHRRVNNYAL